MTYHTQYRYYKRSEEPEGRAQVVLQEEQECTFTLEYWGQGQWLDGRAWWWRIRQEDDFWEIPGDAAFSEISRMNDCNGTETKHSAQVEDAGQQVKDDRQTHEAIGAEWTETFTPLEVASIALHEMFEASIFAGFNDQQALSVLGNIIKSNQKTLGLDK